MNLTNPQYRAKAIALDAQARSSTSREYANPNAAVALPKFSNVSYGMNNTVNCSALFGTLRTATRLDYVKQAFDATNGGRITYKGPELRQDDKSVVLELIHQRRNMLGGEVEFYPSTLCAKMGWSDSRDAKDRLFGCLERLCEGTLRLDKTSTDGAMFHLLAGFKWSRDGKWSVTVTDDVANLFPNKHYAYLNIEKRALLMPGLQTWLFDYISSNDCSMVMTYATLRVVSGRPDEASKQFADYVKAALTKLQSIGAITGFSTATCPNTKKAGLLIIKK
jgi:hypothetical protein